MTTLQTVNASASPEVQMNDNFETLSALGMFGKNQVTTAGLAWGYYGGVYNGNTISDGTVTLTASSDNYVVVNRSTGVVSTATNTTNWVSTSYAKLYKVTTSTTAPTTVVDSRQDTNGLFATTSGSSVDVATVGSLISGATGKTTPVDADSVGLSDSAASNVLKKLTWANVKATLKTYFDTLYAATGSVSGTNTGDQLVFKTIAVSGQSDVVADTATDTLTLVAGTNITLTTNAGADSITIDATGGSGGSSVAVATKTATYNILLADAGKLIRMTGTTAAANALTSTSTAATLGNGFCFYWENASTGTAATDKKSTFTPTTSTIDGAASITTYPGDLRLVVSDGTNWNSILIRGGYLEVAQSDSGFSFVRPTGFTLAEVHVWAGGGGGAGGRGGAAGTGRPGGGGGGGAARTARTFTFADLSSTTTCTVGAGGTAGTGGSSGAGTGGGLGVASSFGASTTALGGGGGGTSASAAAGGGGGGGGGVTTVGGAASNASGGTGGLAMTSTIGSGGSGFNSFGDGGGTGAFAIAGAPSVGGSSIGGGAGGGASSNDTSIGSAGGSSLKSAAGGGSGGNVTTGNTEIAGATGGSTGPGVSTSGGGGGAGGSARNPGTTSTMTDVSIGGFGGGGGGGNNAGTGGAGATGSVPGGGGGGGGGGTTTGGAGGVGGAGAIRIWYWP